MPPAAVTHNCSRRGGRRKPVHPNPGCDGAASGGRPHVSRVRSPSTQPIRSPHPGHLAGCPANRRPHAGQSFSAASRSITCCAALRATGSSAASDSSSSLVTAARASVPATASRYLVPQPFVEHAPGGETTWDGMPARARMRPISRRRGKPPSATKMGFSKSTGGAYPIARALEGSSNRETRRTLQLRRRRP